MHHANPLQQWHLPYMLSHVEHSGVICPAAHCSVGTRSSARHQSQKRPAMSPQSTHPRMSVAVSPRASTSMHPVEGVSMPPLPERPEQQLQAEYYTVEGRLVQAE